MRFKNLSFNENEIIERTFGKGYSYYASYSRKDDLKKGLFLGGQLICISGVSYLTSLLARELWFSSMTSPVYKYEEFSKELEKPIRIPAYDEEGKEFYLKEYKTIEAKSMLGHDVFKERLRELPIIKDIPLMKEIPNFIADQIQNAENTMIENFVRENGPSLFHTMVTNEVLQFFLSLMKMGVDPKEAQKMAKEYYEELISSKEARESAENYIRENIAKPIACYKIVEMESNYIGSAVGATTFLTLSSLIFRDEIKSGLRKACSGIKYLYKKILTGGEEEINEE
jgi:hypothetical protein